jgi:hypothetical protein
MPLDYTLIDASTKYSSDKLLSLGATHCPELFFLDNFLFPDLLDKLLDHITKEQLLWEKERNQENLNRVKLNWQYDTVIEETHIVMENLTNQVNNFFNCNHYFHGITIWKDQYPYALGRHCDNPDIGIALQVYLTGGIKELGTQFEYNDSVIQPVYQVNNGYIMNNNTRIPHSVTTVSEGHTRYSLYAIWGKTPKI